MATALSYPPPWGTRRIVVGIAAGLAVLALIIAFSVPATRRYLANPAGQPAAIGVTNLSVMYDGFQRHRFAPSVVQVPSGTTITWEFADRGASGNDTPVGHNVVGAGWGSPVLASGTWQHTFTAPGTYRYLCSLHPGMDGVVEVVSN